MKNITLFIFLVLSFNICASDAEDWQAKDKDKDKVEHNNKKYKAPFSWSLKSAEQGDAESQFNLAYMHANGKDAPEKNQHAAYAVAAIKEYVAKKQKNIIAKKLSASALK